MAVVGATVTLRFSWTWGEHGPPLPFPPCEDMYLVFEGRRGPGPSYVIQAVRRMPRSPRPHRYELTCMRIDPDDVPEDGFVVPCERYPRRRRP